MTEIPTRERFSIATEPGIDALLRANMPVAIGVSGGKDSTAAAWATIRHLDSIGHTGPRILIHSDLGRVEWHDSLPTCQRLADRMGLELVVVRRTSGDMMDRWLSRWDANVDRYQNLSCVKLILPWSTPAMRFCTSELKTAIICRELVRRFPGKTIISVTGIRREESASRAKMPVVKVENKLTSLTHLTMGLAWNPIIDWKLDEEVWPLHQEYDLPIHEAYTTYGASRVSCCFCIMSAADDILAGLSDERNHDLFREMVDLEICSTFSFQTKWLADLAGPAYAHLLSNQTWEQLAAAKQAAVVREAAEAQIPKHLLYTKGWPTCVPTLDEADLLADVRRIVSNAVGIEINYVDRVSIIKRYETLMSLKPKQSIDISEE